MRTTAYMTAAHYEAYGMIDELECEVARVRRQIERDWRGKRLQIATHNLSVMVDQLQDAVHSWEEEDENAPTVDAINAAKASNE